MGRVLVLAAAYNLIWGTAVVLAPAAPFRLLDMPEPLYPALWQCIGMIVGVFGIGYAVAARDPLRHWSIVLVGLAGKILGPIGFVWVALDGQLPWAAGLTILTNDLVWWVPFALILRGAVRAHRLRTTPPVVPLDVALKVYHDDRGRDLAEASQHQPLLVVFLRHFGCTFCREALSDLQAARSRIETAAARIVLVHMSEDEEARGVFARYGLDDVMRISDPERVLYRAFSLQRGTPRQLLGWSVWKRGWQAGVREGHGVGWLQGDGFQMPGAFVLWRGEVVQRYVHRTAADRPDYVSLADAFDEACDPDDGLEIPPELGVLQGGQN
jgi:peroxiredoxin